MTGAVCPCHFLSVTLSVTASPCHLPHHREALGSGIQHIFDKNPVTSCRVVYENMGHRTHQLAVLNNEASAHE